MGEGRIGGFTQPVEHEAELKLQGELHRTTALTGRPLSFLTRYPEAVFLCSTPVLTERKKQRVR
jgi:hypothetical protein